MYNQIIFTNGGNPYVTTSNKRFFEMICKYNVTQIGEHTFRVESERKPSRMTYNVCKDIVREFAKEWQYAYGELTYSWLDIAEWECFFKEYGRRYGLMREFHENAIV